MRCGHAATQMRGRGGGGGRLSTRGSLDLFFGMHSLLYGRNNRRRAVAAVAAVPAACDDARGPSSAAAADDYHSSAAECRRQLRAWALAHSQGGVGLDGGGGWLAAAHPRWESPSLRRRRWGPRRAPCADVSRFTVEKLHARWCVQRRGWGVNSGTHNRQAATERGVGRLPVSSRFPWLVCESLI